VFGLQIDNANLEDLAREIAEKTGFEEDVIRQNYLLDSLEKKISKLIGSKSESYSNQLC
jgi:hypothetical protein